MKNIYFKDKAGNFGDDLNEWLWPKIFDKMTSNDDDDVSFIGIGSIFAEATLKKLKLDQNSTKKIVFGSGLRYYDSYPLSKIDATWDIKFLRGPLSSKALNNKYDYITDAAYALRQLDSFSTIQNTPKKYKVSLMPYFRSTSYVDWETLCKKLGYHYISPHAEHGIEFTLSEIAASERIITEAMHGAIVADIMRVPWSRFVLSTYYNEGPLVSDFKWLDWTLSIGLDALDKNTIQLYKKNRITRWLKRNTGNIISMEIFNKRKVIEELLMSLRNPAKFYISDEAVIRTIDQKIADKIRQLKNS